MKITGAVVALLLAGCAGGTGLGGGANFYSKTGGTDAQRLADYFACRRQMQTEISVSPWLWSPAGTAVERPWMGPCMAEKGYRLGIYATDPEGK